MVLHGFGVFKRLAYSCFKVIKPLLNIVGIRAVKEYPGVNLKHCGDFLEGVEARAAGPEGNVQSAFSGPDLFSKPAQGYLTFFAEVADNCEVCHVILILALLCVL